MILQYEEACRTVIDQIPEPHGAKLPIPLCRDLILAEDITAGKSLPCDNFSAINGYAMRAEDTKGATREFPVEARVVKRLKAGVFFKRALTRGEAVRVLSGSLLPPGANTVVDSEDADRTGKTLKVYRAMATGENVRSRGEDVAEGEVVLKAGRRIRPQEIAMLTAMGYQEISVFPRPEVAVLVTGAEHVQIGDRCKPGQVWNCLSPLLTSLTEEIGGVVRDLGQVKESRWALPGKIREGLRSPIFVIAGGVFVREYDLIKDILKRCHVKEIFWRVNMRPGRSIFFGRGKKSFIFGLPNTPGSVFVGFEEFIRPAILKWLGRERLRRREIMAVAGTDIRNHSGRTFFVRSFLRRNGKNVTVFPSGKQDSHLVKTLSRSNALVAMEESVELIRRGDRVKVRVLD